MKLLATILAFLVSTTALAAFNFTISGRIQNPDGTLLNAPAVNFKVQVRSPNSDNCLLYEEIQTVPNITNGDFILRVGTGTRAAPSIDGGLPLASVLKNDKLLNLAAATAPCAAAVSTYTPLTNDNRKIYISFNDGSANGPQVLGTIDLNWTPLAIYADRANSTNQLQNTPVSLLPPSLNQVLQFDGINWTPTNPASALPFQAGSAGKVLGTDGSIASWVAAISTVLPSAQMLVGSSSNVATAVSMSGDASISNTGVLTLSPSGVTAGSVGSASAIPSFIVDSKGRVTTVSSQAYQDATALAKGIVQVGSNLTIAAGTLSLTGANVNSALGYTPASGALPTAKIFVGSAGGMAVGVLVSGDISITSSGAVSLANSGVTAGTYGSANQVSQITVDTKGRVTSVLPVSINDSSKLPLAGGTMTGAISMGAFDITGSGSILMSTNKTFQVSNLTPAQQTTLIASLLPADAGKTWYNTGTNSLTYWNGTAVQQLATGSSSISNINGLTAATQSFAVGTSGTDFGVSSVGSTHTFNIPTASATNRGALASADYTIFNNKLSPALTAGQVFVGSAGNIATGVAISGDATLSNAGVLTINTSGVTAGAGYTKFSVDSKGRITLAGSLSSSDVTTALAYTPVSNALTSGQIFVGSAGNVATGVSVFGDAVLSSIGALSLAASGVTAGSVGSASTVPSLTVDAKGRVTAISSQAYQDATALAKGIVQVGSNLTIAAGTVSLVASGVTGALGFTPLNKAGDTMSGALNMGTFDITGSGNILMSSNKTFQVSNLNPAQEATLTASLLAADTGKTWYNTGTNSLMYWNGTSAQQIATGTSSISSLNGLTTATQIFAVGTSGTDFGISSVGSTHTFNIPTATATNRGALSSADFTTFNNKLSSSLSSGQIFVGSAGNVATGVSLSGDATISNAGALSLSTSGVTAGTVGSATAVPSLTVDAKGRVTFISSQAYADATGVTKGIVQVGSNLTSSAGIISLTSAGVTGALTYTPVSNALTSGQVFVGSVGNVATGVVISGDAALSNSGALTLANSGVTAGTSTKVTYDSKGRVTAGASLTATDIPALDASKITTGILPVTLGGTGAATADAALNNLLPTQTANSGKFLQTNGTNTSWVLGNSGTVTNVSGSGPISVTNPSNTPVISIATANTTTTGALTFGDWNIFNGKLSPTLNSAQIFVGSAGNLATGVTLSGDATISNTGTLALISSGVTAATYGSANQVSQITVDTKGRVTSATSVTINDNTKLPLAGGTMSGAIAMGNFDITGSGNILMSANKTFQVSNLTPAQQTTLVASLLLADAGKTWYNTGTNALMYWTGTSAQQLATGSSSISNINGLTAATQSFAVGTSGTDFGVSSVGSTHTFNIPTASATNRGALASADYTIFNNKLSSTLTSGQVFVGSAGNVATGVAISGDASISNSGVLALSTSGVTAGAGYTKFTVDSKGRITLAGALNSSDVTTALTYTPVSNALTSGNIYVGSAGNVATGVALSGDATISNAGVLSLAASGVTAGTVGSSTAVPSITVDAKGRVTAVSSQAYQDATGVSKGVLQVGSNLSVAAGIVSLTSAGVTGALTYTPVSNSLTSGQVLVGSAGNVATGVAISGDATISNTGALTLANSGVAAGTSTKVTYDTKGRVTAGASLSATDIPALDASKITTGILPVTLGGTGAATVNGALNNILPTQTSNAGKVLGTDGTNTSWVSALTNTLNSSQIFVGNAGNLATSVSLSGDATLANTGALTLANSGVTAGTYGSANQVSQIAVDAKGRVTAASSTTINDSTKLPLAGGTMSGAINMGTFDITGSGNILMTSNKSFQVSNLTPAQQTILVASLLAADAGKTWFNTGTNSLMYWNGTSAQQIATGTSSISSLNGLTTPTQTFAVGTSGTDFGINSVGSTHTFNIPSASATNRGVLSSADFTTFNNKLSSTLTSAQIFIGSAGNVATGVSLSGDASISNAGALTLANSGVTAGAGYTKFTVDSKGRITLAGSLISSDVTTALTYTPVSNSLTSGQVFVGSAGNIATGIVLSGDATLSNAGALTLANSGVIAGTVGSSTAVPSLTVDAKGRVTSISSQAYTDATGVSKGIVQVGSNLSVAAGVVSLTSAGVTGALTYTPVSNALTSGNIYVGSAGNVATGVAISGDAALANSGALTLANSGVVAGTVGTAGAVPSLTVDAKGRVTAVSSQAYQDATGASKGIIQVGSNLSSAAGVISLTSAGVTGALTYAPLNKAGDTMSGALNMGTFDITGSGNILMSANKSIQISNLTPAQQTTLVASLLAADAGKTWFNTGTNSLMYWNGTSAQQVATGASSISNINGLTTATQSFAVGTSGTDFGISSVGSTHTFNIPNASATNRGVLASADFTAFNNKLNSTLTSAQIFVGSAGNIATGVIVSGDATISNTGVVSLASSGVTAGTSTKVTYDAKGRVTVGASLAATDIPSLDVSKITTGILPITLGGTGAATVSAALNNLAPVQTANAGKFLQTDGTNITWVAGNTGTVTNVSGSGPISVTNPSNTPVISIATANTTTTGALAFSDWNIFNGKLGSSLTSGNIFVGSAGNVATGVAVSGDATISNAGALTLANSGVIAGTVGSATAVPSLTVDAKGRVTSISSQAYADATGASKGIVQVGSNLSSAAGVISLTSAGVTGALTYTPVSNSLTSGQVFVGSAGNVATGVAISGDATISNTGALTLAASGIIAGTYNSVTVDAKGRATAASNVANSLNANQTLSNLTAPTSVNQNLIPLTDSTYNLGTAASRWQFIFTSGMAASANISANTFSLAGSGLNIGPSTVTPSGGVSNAIVAGSNGAMDMFVTTVNQTASTPSAAVRIESGNTVTANTGDVSLRAGVPSTSGSRGQIILNGSAINASASKIINLADPTLPQDSATKNYVDTRGFGSGTVTNVTGTAPISVATGTTTPSITIATANTTTTGALISADWNVFNGKLGSSLTSGNIFVGSAGNVATGVALSGDATISTAGALTLTNGATTRSNLGLGTSAVYNAPVTGDASAAQVVKGDDSRLTNSRAPSGSASGDLTGTYPAPTLANIVVAGTSTKITYDSKGRITAGTTLASTDIPALDASKITTGILPVTLGGTGLSTTTANQLLYSSGANTIAGLATTNNGVLTTGASGIPSVTASLPAAVQSNITSVGTVTSGVWSGTAIAATKGGTGQTGYTIGDLLYANTATTLAPLSAVATAGYVLTNTGSGSAPQWLAPAGSGTVSSGTINKMAYYAAGGTTVTSNANVTMAAGNMTLGQVGTLGSLAVAGNTSGTVTIQPQAAAGTYNFNLPITAGTSGQVLTSAGGAAAPMTWTTPTTGTVTSVSSANADIGVSMASPTPVLTLNSGTAASQIVKLDATAKLPAVDGSQLTGFTAAQIPSLDASKITTGAVAAARGGTGQTGYTIGDMLYADTATTLAKLPAGATAGNVLTSQGSSSAPIWSAVNDSSKLPLAGGTISGSIVPGTTSAYTLGSGSFIFNGVYAGQINSSASVNIDVTGRAMYDSSVIMSLDWQNRRLKDTAGAIAAQWGTSYFTAVKDLWVQARQVMFSTNNASAGGTFLNQLTSTTSQTSFTASTGTVTVQGIVNAPSGTQMVITIPNPMILTLTHNDAGAFSASYKIFLPAAYQAGGLSITGPGAVTLMYLTTGGAGATNSGWYVISKSP